MTSSADVHFLVPCARTAYCIDPAQMMHVLLVDDERAVTHSLSRYLCARGILVDQAELCSEATAAVLRGHYDAVLLDIRLRDGNGLEIVRTIHRERLHVPVVLYSGFATLDSVLEAGRLGVVSVLTKPKHPKEVMEALLSAGSTDRRGVGPLENLRKQLLELDLTDLRTRETCLQLVLRALADHRVNLWQFAALAGYVRRQALLASAGLVEDLAIALDVAVNSPAANDPALRLMLEVVARSHLIHPQELAVASGIATYRFKSTLKAASPRTPRAWARLARVRRCFRRVILTGCSISECAYAAGYPTARQFDRDCRTEFALCPKDLRRLAGLR